ncbi:hypothetical protein [Streptomyces sp. NBC_01483]|uniref:hypothetical protein n=1 Tax=Streptomyces sp. NBC_01483 TaxID=2903883 RepID=UPI002E33E0B6|nr:hypothetical protein [Streptomyces sp. NBC_01483]
MADEPTNGELWRLIETMRGDFRDDLAQIQAHLGRVVSADVYAVEKAAIAKDIADLVKVVEAMQRQRQADAERVTQTRRWLVACVIIPVLGLVLPVLLFMVGGKS